MAVIPGRAPADLHAAADLPLQPLLVQPDASADMQEDVLEMEYLQHLAEHARVDEAARYDYYGAVPAVRALLEAELYAEPVPADEDAVLMDDTHDDGTIQQAEDQVLVMHWAEEAERAERLRRHVGELHRTTFERTCSICWETLPFGADGRTTVTLGCHSSHQFCATCVAGAWRHQRPARCPLCRTPASPADVEYVQAADQRASICDWAADAHDQDAARQAAWDALPPAPECEPLPPAMSPAQAVAPVPGQWEAIDRYDVLSCCLSPCTQLLDVPTELRVHWARATADVLGQVAAARAAGDAMLLERSLKWYLCYHAVLLRGPRRGTRGGGRMAGVVEGQFVRWREGERRQLLVEWAADRRRAEVAHTQRAHAPRTPLSPEQAAAEAESERVRDVSRALEYIAEGELSRGLRALHSYGIAQVSPAVLAQLRAKHPQRARPVPRDLPVPTPHVAVALTETFRGLRRRSGTGPSGARNEYLRALVGAFDDAHADSVMGLYDAFASAFASADLPRWFYAAESFASLLPLVKKALSPAQRAAGVEPDVRPVAVGEVGPRSVLSHVTESLVPAMSDVLAPQQVAVGVPGGISILIHGLRVLMEYRQDFVIVRLDLQNAYNAADRAALLRRFSEQPSLRPLLPLLHASLAHGTGLRVGGQQQSLFESQVRGDSSTGTQQGAPPSSGVFCVGIQPELQALDEELRPFGGCARGIMDDIYAAGPPPVVFPAVMRFALAVQTALDLHLQVEKSSCFAPAYDLSTCPWRARAGIPLGSFTAPEPQADGAGVDRQSFGIMVGGVPLGTTQYVLDTFSAEVDDVVSYIQHTVSQLLVDSPHATWSALYYCCSTRIDYWLRHLPPCFTMPHVVRVDAALREAVDQLGYAGMVGDDITHERMLLPARMRGLGLRSRLRLAPAAFTSCFVESVERFLDGPAGPGLFPMLQILLGSRDAHLSYFLALPWSHTASEFRAAWVAMQQEVAGSGVSGPLDGAAWQAGQGRGSSAGLQRLITTQREQVARDRLHHRIMGLPHGDTRREAWLACDAFSSGWIGAWPSERDALSPAEFREVIATYLGRESPAVRALAGRSIPCCQRARRGGRVCDAYGQQLGLATLTDRAHGECHDYIAAGIFRDVLHSGMRGDTECRGVFASVLPVRILEHGDGERGRGELGIVPDARIHCRMHTASVDRCTAHQRYRGRTEQRGAQERHAADHLFDLKTVHGGGPCYQSARARDDGQCGAVAQRAATVHRDYVRHAARLDRRSDVQAFNAGSTDAVSTVLRGFPQVRALVVGQYGEASLDVHELLELAVDSATSRDWRYLGARSQSEARGYYTASMRRAWGCLFVREMARHRLRRVIFVGSGHRPRASQAVQGDAAVWGHRSPAEFAAHAGRRMGAFAGLSARRGVPARRAA